MRRIITLGLVSLLLLGFLGIMAQGRSPMHVSNKMDMGKKLKLSDEQRQKMMDLRLQLKKDLLPLRSKLISLQTELKLQIASDNPNQGKIDDLIDQMASIRKEIQQRRVQHQLSIREMLTPEQRKIFDQRVLSPRHHKKQKMMKRMHTPRPKRS